MKNRRTKKAPLIDKLEKKWGKYAISNLGKYIIMMYSLGTIISFLNEGFYYEWLALDFGQVLKGQVWRLITFMMQPPVEDLSGANLLLCMVALAFYYWVFNALEKALGSFRLNLYYFSGVLLNVIISLIYFIVIYCITGQMLPTNTSLLYVNDSLFLAFAVLFPNVTVYLMMMIPVKMKWAAVVLGGFMLYDFGRLEYILFMVSPLIAVFYFLAFCVSFLNFIIFVVAIKKSKSTGKAHKKVKKAFDRQVVMSKAGARHKCCICGRTELDDENLEFRFCSRCSGNKEYCNVHLFTHEHVK